jgi:hypothetical protein
MTLPGFGRNNRMHMLITRLAARLPYRSGGLFCTLLAEDAPQFVNLRPTAARFAIYGLLLLLKAASIAIRRCGIEAIRPRT